MKKWYISIRFWFVLLWALCIIPVGAATTPLQPGGTLTVDCANGNVLTKRGVTTTNSQAVSARMTMALDSTGTVLTINVQNNATSPDALLYGIDLGLSSKFVTNSRMVASFSGFPAGARWLGPTDLSNATNGIGVSTIAAREVLAGRMEDYLKPQKEGLPAGFLRVGQGGTITVRLTLTAENRQRPLLLDPVAYFLVNDPKTAGGRMQIASTRVAR